MKVTITLEENSLLWLKQNIKTGLGRKQRRQREAVLKELSVTTPRKVQAEPVKRVHGNMGRIRYGTATYALLDQINRAGDLGLTTTEAQETLSATAVAARLEVIMTNCSKLKVKGLLRTDGRRDGRYVNKITAKGKRALKEALASHKQRSEMAAG
jgi:DNA-binding PadR family transcriptional regulator